MYFLEPPKLVQRPDALMQITKDERISIKCAFRGRPEPTISWLYNGEEFTANGLPITGTSMFDDRHTNESNCTVVLSCVGI
jgi:hypothetical protein